MLSWTLRAFERFSSSVRRCRSLYLLKQRLKWLAVHKQLCEVTAGGLTVGRNLQGMGPPAAVRAPLHNRTKRADSVLSNQPVANTRTSSAGATFAANLHSSAWWDRSLRWAAAGSRWKTTHRSTTSYSPARLRHVRGSASFRHPPATPTVGSPRSTRRSRNGTASRAACGSSARPSARSTISQRRT